MKLKCRYPKTNRCHFHLQAVIRGSGYDLNVKTNRIHHTISGVVDVLRHGEASGAKQRRRVASSQAVSSKWLRTSALPERIAKNYEQMAERHDQNAERFEWEC